MKICRGMACDTHNVRMIAVLGIIRIEIKSTPMPKHRKRGSGHNSLAKSLIF